MLLLHDKFLYLLLFFFSFSFPLYSGEEIQPLIVNPEVRLYNDVFVNPNISSFDSSRSWSPSVDSKRSIHITLPPLHSGERSRLRVIDIDHNSSSDFLNFEISKPSSSSPSNASLDSGIPGLFLPEVLAAEQCLLFSDPSSPNLSEEKLYPIDTLTITPAEKDIQLFSSPSTFSNDLLQQQQINSFALPELYSDSTPPAMPFTSEEIDIIIPKADSNSIILIDPPHNSQVITPTRSLNNILKPSSTNY